MKFPFSCIIKHPSQVGKQSLYRLYETMILICHKIWRLQLSSLKNAIRRLKKSYSHSREQITKFYLRDGLLWDGLLTFIIFWGFSRVAPPPLGIHLITSWFGWTFLRIIRFFVTNIWEYNTYCNWIKPGSTFKQFIGIRQIVAAQYVIGKKSL